MRKNFFLLLGFLLAALPAAAQLNTAPEKVFVHIDRTYYAAGETMWLRGYVEPAAKVAEPSRFLYVELLETERGEAIVRVKVKQGRDGFAGHLDIPDTLASGIYLLRAYTRWQLNWPEDQLFRIPVGILGADGDPSGLMAGIARMPEAPAEGQVLLTVQSEGESWAPRMRRRVRLRLPEGIDSADVSVSVVRRPFRSYQQADGLRWFDAGVDLSQRELTLPRESMQYLTGTVRGLSSRKPRRYMLSVVAPSLNYSQIAEVQEGSRFMIDSLDFRDSTVFILTATRDGGMQKYSPSIDPDPVAPPAGPWRPEPVSASTRQTIEEEPVSFPEGTFLRDTIQTLTVQADYVRIKSPFGNVPRTGAKTREQLGPYDHMNIVDYVLMMKPSFEKSTGEGGTSIRDTRSHESFGEIALCVNGFRMDWEVGETIRISEVEKLSITLRDTDSFLLHADGVVLVELSGAGRQTLEEQGNTAIYVPLGWQTPRDFKHPRYDQPHIGAFDQRNTIYWNPSLNLWGRFPTSITFYTDDLGDGPYWIHIEGRTSDGRWISQSQAL